MRDLDLASFAGFRSEDALLLAAVLAGAEQLQRISLPADASLSAAALQALTAAVLQLPALEWVNGAELVALQGEQLECGGRALGPVGGAVVAHKVRTQLCVVSSACLLYLSARVLAAVVAYVVAYGYAHTRRLPTTPVATCRCWAAVAPS